MTAFLVNRGQHTRHTVGDKHHRVMDERSALTAAFFDGQQQGGGD